MKRFGKFILKYFTAFLGSLWLFTFGLFFGRNRDLLTTLALRFGYGRKKGQKTPPILPEIELKNLVPEALPIRLLEMDYARGNVSLEELAVINQLVKVRAPQKIFEMGTFDGRTTLNLAANCPEGSLVYSLDLPKSQVDSTGLQLEEGEKELIEKETSGDRYLGRREAEKIIQLYGDTASFDFSPYYNAVDFVFIDASHAHSYVLNDSLIALRLLRNGKGTVLWHDYAEWNGVTSALNKLYKTNPNFRGVCRIRGTYLVALILE